MTAIVAFGKNNLMNTFQAPKPKTKYVFSLLAVTIAYFLFGLFGLQLAIQPGYASAIWPSAGIALAAMILLGNRIFPAVLLGSFLVNTWISYQSALTINLMGVAIAFVISLGAATQAYIGAQLIRKYVGYPCPLITDRSILLFLTLSGPISCLISATVGVGILLTSGITSAKFALTQWGTWWIGDTIGILIFTPLIFIYAAEPRSIWSSRKQTVFIPLVICFLAVLTLFYFSSGWEQTRVLQNKSIVSYNSLANWYVLSGGLLFTAFLGGLLLILTGRRSIIEDEVKLRTTALEKTKTQCIHKINQHQAAKEEIIRQQKFLQRIIDTVPNFIFVKDRESRFVLVNKALADAYGSSVEQLIGKSDTDFNSNKEETDHFHRDDLEVINNKIEKIIPEETITTVDGSVRWLQTIKLPLTNEVGVTDQLLGVATDITERKHANDLLSFQATHDPLTELINRREFERRLERLLLTIQQDNLKHVLCFMDLDQFKIVNDSGGHIAGDELLRQLSQVLQKSVRKRDTLARLGGDEFGVLMEHCTLKQAHRVASSLQDAIQNYQFIWEGQSFNVGVSIGLVAISEITINLTELMRQADAACYMAKDKGRNRIHVFHEDDIDTATRHSEVQWVTRIQQALEENRFCLYSQVIHSLNHTADFHYELLIRMLDNENNSISPDAFLPAAERYNLIEEIDCWVIAKAFTCLSTHPEFVEQLSFCSINLSGASLANPQMLAFIIKELKEKNIDCSKICFEITETAAISNLSITIEFISTLKKLGCRFALDDFGSGLSSFSCLKNLPVDYLKIDGMFVKNIVNDPVDYAMVKSINEISQVMGIQTIAKFVENEKIKNKLKTIGVDYIQGDSIGVPVPFDQFLRK